MTAVPIERKLISGVKAHILTKEDSIKGGRAVTKAKRLANLITQSHKAKCGNCKAICFLKESNPKSITCPIPEARAKAIFYDKPVIDKGVLQRLSHKTLDRMYSKSTGATLSDLKIIHSAINESLRTEYPVIQKSFNIHGHMGEITVNIIREDLKDKKKE